MLLLALPYFPPPFGKEKQVNLLHLYPVVLPNTMPIRYSIVKEPKYCNPFGRAAFNQFRCFSFYRLTELIEGCVIFWDGGPG